MRLPVIKHIVSFIENNDEDFVIETMETLENLIDLESLKDEKLSTKKRIALARKHTEDVDADEDCDEYE